MLTNQQVPAPADRHPRIETGLDRPTAPRKVRIVGKSNGVGLARDMKLLADCLQADGHQVSVHAINDGEARRRRSLLQQLLVRVRLATQWIRGQPRLEDVHLNVMLEHIWPEFLSRAHANVVVPNPEWFDRNDVRFLRHADRVWAKTRQTAKIFDALGASTQFISFNSEDRYQPDVRRERRFLHLAGKSTMKGTDRLLRAWAQHPEWPVLTVIQHSADQHAPEISAANIDRRCGYLPDEELRRVQNECLFHLCPSLSEGWGHYIAEALSIGAVVLTVDAPPMNELVTSDRGLLMSYEHTGTQRLARTYRFASDQLRVAVERAIGMREDEVARLSANARAWFHSNRSDFAQRVRTAARELVK